MHRRTAVTRMLPIVVLVMAPMVATAGTARARGEQGAIPTRGALAPPAALVVTPSTGLVDDQAVTVTAPSGVETYVLCPTGSVSDPQNCSFVADHVVGHATDVVHLPARTFASDTSGTGSIVDCRTASCSLVAVTITSSGDFAIVPLAAATVGFAPAGALRAPPTITATPNTDLVDGQQITVTVTQSGADQTADDAIALECTRPVIDPSDLFAAATFCGFDHFIAFDGPDGGPYTAQPTVGAYIETSTGPVDCRAPGATCTLVTVDAVAQVANAPLGFTADGPVHPALLARPITDLSGPLSSAIYDLVGFTPNDPYTVRWCNGSGACLPTTVATGTLDAQGMGSFSPVDDAFDGSTDGSICSDGCSLTATDAHGLTATGDATLIIDVFSPVPQGPFHSKRLPVKVTPHKGLRDGDTVTVTASGFEPGAALSIVECNSVAATKGAAACDLDTSTALSGRDLTADAHGNLTATYKIRQHITTPADGPLDCAKGNVDPDAYDAAIAADPDRANTALPGYFTCTVVVADIGDYQQSGGDPIAFAGASFKPLPWQTAPVPVTATATPAVPVTAQPTFTG